jgi:hypothetical protein
MGRVAENCFGHVALKHLSAPQSPNRGETRGWPYVFPTLFRAIQKGKRNAQFAEVFRP